MTTLAELQAAPAFLVRAMQQDVALSLAQAAAWLDPLHFLDPELVEDTYYDGAYEEDPDALVLFALGVARRCFPATYCALVDGLRAGRDFRQVESAFAEGVRAAYPHIELDSLYDMVYGVPLPFVGLDVPAPDFLDAHPDYAALLSEFFDLEPTAARPGGWREAYQVIDDDDFEALRSLAGPLIHSLIAQDRQPCADLAFLLMYLFSCTGNSLLDFSADTYWDAGFEPLEWEPERLDMADEACREMVIVLDAAERAMQLLAIDEELSRALKNTIAALKAAERNEDGNDPVALNWPDGYRAGGAEPGDPGDTGPDAALVFLRSAFAEAD